MAAIGALFLSLVVGSTAASAQMQASTLIAQSFDLRSIPAPMLQAVTRVAAPVQTTTTLPMSTLGSATTLPTAPINAPSAIPLSALVDANSVGELDEQANCLATAVYFESKGEPLEGQLAVAQVVMNRAASGRYPATLCGVVKQRAQFSFVRNGAFPSLDVNCNSWRRARAIARIAQKRLVVTVPADVLWYHANYVTPHWRGALIKVEQIGAHIFYRA